MRTAIAVMACAFGAGALAAEPAGSAATGASGGVDRTADATIQPHSEADWLALARLPDWTGVWTPDITDQFRQIETNPTPWNAQAQAKVDALVAEEKAGRPKGLFIDCLPEAMPSWMLISHNAFEVLFTPGRVTLLGESDSNRLRRIYTDGRAHSEDPDPSFHGESIGHWEGDVLVVDTIGILPQTYIAVSEAVGLPNNGDLHVRERIFLADPDTMHVELEITAPHVLTRPWKTTRIYYRQRERRAEVIEGVCLQGAFRATVDAAGDAVWVPRVQQDGNRLPEE